MKFSIGDKVRFLNENQKGVVSQIISSNQVKVMIDAGFEVPVLESELVPDGFPEPVKQKTESVAAPTPVTELAHPIQVNQQANLKRNKILVCFEAQDATKLGSSDLNLHLINQTGYFLSGSCFSAMGSSYKWLQNLELAPASSLLLQRIKREKINEWREIRFQLICFEKENFSPKAPIDASLKIKQDKFFIDRSYEASAFVPGPCILQELYSFEAPLTISEKDLKQLFEGSKTIVKDNFHRQLIKQQQQRNDEREIDLHIEEISDNFSGMSNAEIVQLQLRHFTRELDNAISLHLKKLIVIHGVGTGRLKQEVLRVLESYPKLKVRDASYAKYGFGATEIIIS